MKKWNDLTLTDVINYHNFVLAFGTFLDAFRHSENKSNMINAPPLPSSREDENIKLNLCILAASAHKLANDYKIDVPAWVEEPIYKMPYPVYAFDTKNKQYQEYLVENTPYEFEIKNIFYGSSVLERV